MRKQPEQRCIKEIQFHDPHLCQVQHSHLMSFFGNATWLSFFLLIFLLTVLLSSFYQVPTLGVPLGSTQLIFCRPIHLGLKVVFYNIAFPLNPESPWGACLLSQGPRWKEWWVQYSSGKHLQLFGFNSEGVIFGDGVNEWSKYILFIEILTLCVSVCICLRGHVPLWGGGWALSLSAQTTLCCRVMAS